MKIVLTECNRDSKESVNFSELPKTLGYIENEVDALMYCKMFNILSSQFGINYHLGCFDEMEEDK